MLRKFIICLLPLLALSGCGMKTDLVAPSANPDVTVDDKTGETTSTQAAKIGNLLLD